MIYDESLKCGECGRRISTAESFFGANLCSECSETIEMQNHFQSLKDAYKSGAFNEFAVIGKYDLLTDIVFLGTMQLQLA